MRTVIRTAVMALILLSGAAFAGEPGHRVEKDAGVRRQRSVEESRTRRSGGGGRRENRRHYAGFRGRPHHDRDTARALKMYFKYVATPEENARISALRSDHSRLSLWVPGWP
jgi:hypothetical protein